MKDPLIAVVETNPSMSLLLDELLVKAGYEICLWPSQTGSVAFIRERQPDLVVLDLWVQQTSDLDTFIHLCDDAVIRHIPMLICTDDPSLLPREALQCLDQYIILTKPFLLDRFAKQLYDLVDLLIARSTAKTPREMAKLRPQPGRLQANMARIRENEQALSPYPIHVATPARLSD